MDHILRIATLVGDPDMTRFSASSIAGAYDSASRRYRDEDNICYSAASELLTIDVSRLMQEYAVKSDGTGVESDTMQDLSSIIAARKTQIARYDASIVSERQSGAISGFGMRARRIIIDGVND